MKNRQIVLASRPTGPAAGVENFRMREVPIPALEDGQVLVKTSFFSVDPYMRMRLNDVKSYAAPQAVDDVMGGGSVGIVEDSRFPGIVAGDAVAMGGGWQEYAVLSGKTLRKLDTSILPIDAYLGPAGMTGVTAWHGIYNIIAPKKGETILVTAAAGAVGSIAGQLAKQAGARVVGVAGGPDKCGHVVKDLKFDACVDYKAGNLDRDMRAACPDGIDGIFENVGGVVLDAACRNLNAFARIALCGLISSGYSGGQAPLANITALLTQRVMLKGFILSDHADVFPVALPALAAKVAAGELVWRRTIAHGIENAPAAFIGMLAGKNLGKQLVSTSLLNS
jgi:NADPH-dependent curcumin reductase CurA